MSWDMNMLEYEDVHSLHSASHFTAVIEEANRYYGRPYGKSITKTVDGQI